MAQLRGRFNNTDKLARTLNEAVRRATDDPFLRTRRVLASGGASAHKNNIAGQQIVAIDFRTARNVGVDAGGVLFNSDGIEGYNSSLQKTFDIGTDGSGFLGLGATQITWDSAGAVSVPGGGITAGTIDELQLADEAVTNAKIAVDAIQGDVIAAGAITETKVGSGAISTGKLAAAAVTAAKIAAGTITATEIASNAITSAKINAGAVTSDKITVSTLSAINANMGSITAGTITGGTIRSASSGQRVEITSAGLLIHGTPGVGPISQSIQFKSTADGSTDGYLAPISGGVQVGGNMEFGSGAIPFNSGSGDVGTSGAQWSGSYIQTMRTNLITGIGSSVQIHSSAGSNTIGFFGVTPVGRQNVSGSRGGNAALADLITALEDLGLISDSTT